MKKRILVVLATMSIGGALGVGIDRAVLAQQNGIKRTVLQRVDDPSSSSYEAVMGISEIEPGAASGKHFHHGIELGYLLAGTMVVERENGPAVTLKAGDAITNEKGTIHNARNVGASLVKVLAVYIVEKGKPLAEPMP